MNEPFYVLLGTPLEGSVSSHTVGSPNSLQAPYSSHSNHRSVALRQRVNCTSPKAPVFITKLYPIVLSVL